MRATAGGPLRGGRQKGGQTGTHRQFRDRRREALPPRRCRLSRDPPGAQTAQPGGPKTKSRRHSLGSQNREPDLHRWEKWQPVGAGHVLGPRTIPTVGMTALAVEGKAWGCTLGRVEVLVALDGGGWSNG